MRREQFDSELAKIPVNRDHQKEHHHEKVRRDRLHPTSEQRGYDAFREEQRKIDKGIGELAAQVLERELGLELYMVIHLVRDDCVQRRFQVLNFGFRFDRWMSGYGWVWELSGRKLRKDASLGQLTEGMSFCAARIMRRKLDGSWVPLMLRKSQGREHASAAG